MLFSTLAFAAPVMEASGKVDWKAGEKPINGVDGAVFTFIIHVRNRERLGRAMKRSRKLQMDLITAAGYP